MMIIYVLRGAPYFFTFARRTHDLIFHRRRSLFIVIPDVGCTPLCSAKLISTLATKLIDPYLLCFASRTFWFSHILRSKSMQHLSPSYILLLLRCCPSRGVIYFTKCATFPAKFITFFVKCVSQLIFLWWPNISFIIFFEEVTPGASRWSFYLYIAPLNMLVSLCFMLVSLSLYSTP